MIIKKINFFLYSLLLVISTGAIAENKHYLDENREVSFIIPFSQNHHYVHTDIVINATREQVWEVLTDFNSMPIWSSSLLGIEGDIENGA